MIFFFQGTIVIVVGLLMRALWKAGQPRRYFTIRVINGQTRAVEGTVTPALLRLVAEVVAFNEVKTGWISGVESGSGIRLEFSKTIPPAARQQLRNGWGTMGWKAPSQKRGRP